MSRRTTPKSRHPLFAEELRVMCEYRRLTARESVAPDGAVARSGVIEDADPGSLLCFRLPAHVCQPRNFAIRG